MLTMHQILRPVALVLSTVMLSISLYTPAAHAAMITTDQVMGVDIASARTQIEMTLMRADVQQALLQQGVNPQDIQARVAALSDAEAAQMVAS